MLAVLESLESATSEQAEQICIPVSGSKPATTEDQAVVEDRSALGIQWLLAANSLLSGRNAINNSTRREHSAIDGLPTFLLL